MATSTSTGTSPSIALSKSSPVRSTADLLVVGALKTADGPELVGPGVEVAAAIGRGFGATLDSLGFVGKPGDVARLPRPAGVKAALVLVVGLGETMSTDALRRAAGVAARSTGKAQKVTLGLPADEPDQVRAVVEGYLLGSYSFTAYKSGKGDDRASEVTVLSDAARRKEATEAVATAQAVSSAVATTRDWVNTPPGDLRPPAFAQAIVDRNKARSGGGRVTVKVYDEKALEELGCGGICGVARGSGAPARLVRLTYSPRGARAHLALVGKGVTFDSGGLSIKPAASMMTMKSDMAGAATIANAILAIADLGLPVKVTAFAPMAENMPSGQAIRPGDVLTMRSGKTVEVLNTDAEGRLLLADALALAVEARPDMIVDAATLTGAVMIALGDRVAGLLGNDSETIDKVQQAAFAAGEALWPLPIPDEMGEKVRTGSKVADLAQHNTERWGGTLYAAAFLREFVGTVPWAHLDIAGTAFNEKAPHGYTPSGGTGMGVATLVELARALAAEA